MSLLGGCQFGALAMVAGAALATVASMSQMATVALVGDIAFVGFGVAWYFLSVRYWRGKSGTRRLWRG